MNFSIYTIFFIAGCTGIYFGLKFNNKWILFPAIAAFIIFAILIIATLLLVGGIN